MADFLTELKRLSEAEKDAAHDTVAAHRVEFEMAMFWRQRAGRIAELIEASDAYVAASVDGKAELATPLANYWIARNALDEGEAA